MEAWSGTWIEKRICFSRVALVILLLVVVLFPVQAFAETVSPTKPLAFQSGPSSRFGRPLWVLRAHVGGGFFFDTGPSLPLGVHVGPFWPKRGVGFDVVGDVVPAVSGTAVVAQCRDDDADCVGEVELKFMSARVGLSPYYGGQVGRSWLYGRIPVLLSLHPLVADGRRKVSVYLNLGAGFGALFNFAKSGFFGFEVIGYVGPALTPVLIKQAQGPLRGGGEGRLQVGWRF